MTDKQEDESRTISLEHKEHARRQNSSRQRRTKPNLRRDEEINLKYGALSVIKLFVPVSLCMLVVVIAISSTTFYTTTDVYYVYTPFHEQSTDTFTILWNAVANSLIFIGAAIIMTSIVVSLYVYKFYKVLYGILILASVMLLNVFTVLFIETLFMAYNLPLDVFTLCIFIWNFGVAGVFCIHWKGPLRLQQAYLIFIAALSGLQLIKMLPEWTTWFILLTVSIWDLVAVLSPVGPLKILIETAQERQDFNLPGLIYSTFIYSSKRSSNGDQDESDETEVEIDDNEQNDVVQSTTTSSPTVTSTKSRKRPRKRKKRAEINFDGPKGVQLGLGDFVFYSLLVGKVSSYGDWITTFACFLAILVGLCSTVFLMTPLRKALPALPISIVLGLVFYLFTGNLVKPFADLIISNQIFI